MFRSTVFRQALGLLRAKPIALLLGVVSLLLATPAHAQEAISELTVINGGSSSIQPPAGYTKINVDLNQGAGGDYIYLCYKKGVGAPITGIAVTINDNPPPSDAEYTRIDVDLNRGSSGDFIWLWYTKDPACTTIHNLEVLVNTTTPSSGFTVIPTDLNQSVGGEYIYFAYEEG
jgi:hypothetical protein